MALTLGREAIGLALSIASGVLLTQYTLNGRPYRASPLLTSFVGCGLGLGVSSLIWFGVWCLAAPRWPFVPVAVEVLTVGLLLWVRRSPSPVLLKQRDTAPIVKWVAVLGTLSVASAVFFFLRFILCEPYGDWDAWAIWNLHARALFVGGGRFWMTELFKIGWSQPEYPLLLPLTVARLWFFTGVESTSAPAVTAFLYTFGTAGVLATGLSQLKGQVSGTLALAMLLGSTKFLWLGLHQYADVPQSFYLLTALVTLALYEWSGESRFLIITGMSSGFAVWTKDEGWMFLGCLIAARLILSIMCRSSRISPANAGAFFVGLVPVLAVAVSYKVMNPAHSLVVSWYLTKSGWMRLLDTKRLLYIAANFGRILWNLDIPFFNSIAILAIYTSLVGFEKDKALRKVSATGLSTIALMLAGYFCVYATSTIDLKWYLTTSLQRLYLQLWPSFLFCLFVTTRTPGTSMERQQNPRRSSWLPERRKVNDPGSHVAEDVRRTRFVDRVSSRV